MSVKKGDLVLFKEEAKPHIPDSISFGDIMVVVKGPYEGLDYIEKTMSSLSVVVDLLVGGDLLKGVPTRFLKRTQDVREYFKAKDIQRG
tara:strand:- start:208 stop:474 length:267 start_codon:yes stop_codon:yes gene_type:complete